MPDVAPMMIAVILFVMVMAAVMFTLAVIAAVVLFAVMITVMFTLAVVVAGGAGGRKLHFPPVQEEHYQFLRGEVFVVAGAVPLFRAEFFGHGFQ